MRHFVIGVVLAACLTALCLPGIAQNEALEDTELDWKTGKTLQEAMNIENQRYGAVLTALWKQKDQDGKEFNRQYNDCQKSDDRQGCYARANAEAQRREKRLSKIAKAASDEHNHRVFLINVTWALKKNEKGLNSGLRKDGFRLELPGYLRHLPRTQNQPSLTPLEQREAQEDAAHAATVKRLNAAWSAEQDRHGRNVAQLKKVADNADLLRLEQQRHDTQVQTMRTQKAAEEARYAALTGRRNPGFVDFMGDEFDF